MVTGAAAEFREELEAFDQCVDDFLRGGQLFFANAGRELADVLRKALFVDIDGFVRTVGRADLDFDGRIRRDLLVPLEGVDRVVRVRGSVMPKYLCSSALDQWYIGLPIAISSASANFTNLSKSGLWPVIYSSGVPLERMTRHL